MILRPHEPKENQDPKADRTVRSWKPWIAVAIGLILVLFLADRYLAHHRQVFVVNGYEEPITLRLPGQDPQAVPGLGRGFLTVSEGEEKVQVSGALEETIPIHVKGGVGERWLGGTDWILNPGGGALLVYETLRLGSSNMLNIQHELLYHERLMKLPKVDFLFVEFPKNAHPDPGQALTRLDRIPITEAAESMLNQGARSNALQLIEWYLHSHPNDTTLLMPYVGLSLGAGRQTQAKEFLEWGTSLRPIRLQWHRFYQDVALNVGGQAELIARYDQMLKADPTNSALIYLRGRLSMFRHEALPLYEKALLFNPNNAFAHNGMAFLYASQGDWATALKSAQRAVELDPEDRQMQELLFDCELAAAPLPELEAKWTMALQTNQVPIIPLLHLASVLMAQNKTNEVDKLVERFAQDSSGPMALRGRDLAEFRYHVFYLKADFPALMALVQQNLQIFGLVDQFQTLLAAGQLEQIEKFVPPNQAPQVDPFYLVVMGLALETANKPDRAVVWQQEALKRLRGERPEYALAASMMENPDQTALNDVLDLAIAPQSKAILLAYLSRHHSTQGEAMRAAAQRLNVRREFPFHWINRLTRP